MSDPQNRGIIKWFNAQKGFGFISPANGGPDVFVHVSAVTASGMKTLKEGQHVAYDLQNDQKTGKTTAVNLKAA